MLKEIDNEDWAEVFGEGKEGDNRKDVDVCPEGAEVDITPPFREDVVEIIAMKDGCAGYAPWMGIFRLKDGRFVYAEGECDFVGWTWSNTWLEVANSLEDFLDDLEDFRLARLGLSMRQNNGKF